MHCGKSSVLRAKEAGDIRLSKPLLPVNRWTNICRKEERLLNKENDMNSEELLRLLFMESSLEHLMTMDTGEVGMPTFAEYITQGHQQGRPRQILRPSAVPRNSEPVPRHGAHARIRIQSGLRESADAAQNSEKVASAPPRQAGHGHHLLPAPRLQHCRDPVSPQ